MAPRARTPARTSPRLTAAAAAAAALHAPHFEFGGPIGASLLLLLLPLLTFALSAYTGAGGWPAHGGLEGLAAHLSSRSGLQLLHDAAAQWDVRVFAAYCLYWFALAVLYLALPGRRARGGALPSGERLQYPLNGLLSLALVVAAAVGVHALAPHTGVRLTRLLAILPALTLANIAFSCLLSAALYAYSFRGGALLAEGGHTGSPVYDFFIGRELNPRITILGAELDLKYFCELRPGLFQWLLLNLACLAQSAEDGGGTPAPAVAAIVAAQVYYVVDALLNEEAILSTMDITLDGFGFMLAFGDLAWVPATYALQARFLVQTQVGGEGGSGALLACAGAVGALGMWIFRASNSEKDEFKRSPQAARFAGARTIGAGGGRRLLVDGWWGCARHINYLGDWLMAVAWCLPCGAASLGALLAWFYPAYFAVLLVHREMRDSEKCAKKYGAAWEQYRAAVPWRIIPYVY